MLNVFKGIGAVALCLVLLIAGWIGVRYILDPERTREALGMMYVVAMSNHNPPPIAASGVLPDGPDWMLAEPTSARFSAALRKSFPPGSEVAAMQATLVQQGFEADQELECSNPGGGVSDLKGKRQCRTHVVPNALRYDWGGLPCNSTLRVSWTADARGRLAAISGTYDAVCL